MKIRTAFLVLTLLPSGSIYAAEPEFEAVYVGCDARATNPPNTPCNKPCELRVLKTDYQGNTNQWEDFRAEVQTSYGHGTDVPGDIVLNTVASDEQLLEGKNADDSVLRATLRDPKSFDSLRAYSLKWKHGDHFHTFICKELKAAPQEP